MPQPADLRFTSEIYARRFLNFGPDHAVIDWAENMTVSGFVSDSLFILLGEAAPFNKFEIDQLLDHIQKDLRLPLVHTRNEALEIIATAHVQRFLQGKTTSADALFALSQLCIEEGYAEVIYDFYLLHFAAVDLEIADFQNYWPDAHKDNIEQIIRDRCIKWREEHPMEEWRAFEWSAVPDQA
ncbi:hypothetical protein J7443_06890 [Tropicibacter sp. R15_0]|uniref:hypothetical protein n=1 Tax=Tropicibacter sp. R15_0 TaxID=2821101 RepID=UPI001ADA9C90|nr:hypothetical protein [Tropicibacter sp. R15_0]MBO9464947.1 hypothetical protein [Tropicibacter sp. R15_0]